LRNERKYKIITLLSVLLSVLLLGNCVREYYRMEAAVVRQEEEYVLKGAKVYAENCMTCHGPKGEGSVGLTLNKPEFQKDWKSTDGKEIYNMLTKTIKEGRKSNSDHPQWVKQPDGHYLSYTTMPAWGKDFGGPLDDHFIKAVTLFIMNPSGEQWEGMVDQFTPPNGLDQVKDKNKLTFKNQDDPNNAAAIALLKDVKKSQCLSCHSLGVTYEGAPIGGKVGPDLSKLGAWGVDEEWLVKWISYANQPNKKDADQTPAMAHDERMPIYWHANRTVGGADEKTGAPKVDLSFKSVAPEGTPYFMPRFKGKLTDDEIRSIAKYLLTLK
jgi:mono/diheme cytochrome c family protein